MTSLPRLYDSSDDLAFEDDEDSSAVTLPQSARSGVRSSEDGVGAFFRTIVRELEREQYPEYESEE